MYIDWRDEAEAERAKLIQACTPPAPPNPKPANRKSVASTHVAPPSGSMPPGDPRYLERPADADALAAARRAPDTLVVRAPRQMGKSSLLKRSLCEDETKGEATAREVIRQTGGHPYLTLRVCDAVAAQPCPSPEQVRAIVGQTFGSLDSLKSDVHFDQMLRFINERVDDKLSTLELYRRVIGGKPVPDQTTPAHINLKLIGLVKRDGRGNLAPRNPIYRRLFTDAWATSQFGPGRLKQNLTAVCRCVRPRNVGADLCVCPGGSRRNQGCQAHRGRHIGLP
ncbi:MAG: hypothetical protein ACREEM_44180, partial [Blastocatellia bacterium]